MKVLYNNCAKRILSNFLWNLKLLATSEQFLFKINQMIIKELKTTTLIKYLLEKMVWLQFIIFLYRKSFPWVKVFVEVVVPTTTSNVLSNVLWHNCSCYLKFYTLSKQTPKKIYYLLEFSFQNCFFFFFQSSTRKSALLSAAKKAKLKSNPSRVRFAESVDINGSPSHNVSFFYSNTFAKN